MSAVFIISSFGKLLCTPFAVNTDKDCLQEKKEEIDLPLPETEVSE